MELFIGLVLILCIFALARILEHCTFLLACWSRKKDFVTLFHFMPRGEKSGERKVLFEKENEVVCEVLTSKANEVEKLEKRLDETTQSFNLFQQAQQEYLSALKIYQTMIETAEFFGYNTKILEKENSPKNAEDSVKLRDDTQEKQEHHKPQQEVEEVRLNAESFPRPKIFNLLLFEVSSESGKKVIIGARDATEAVYNCQDFFDNEPSGEVKKVSNCLLIAKDCEFN